MYWVKLWAYRSELIPTKGVYELNVWVNKLEKIQFVIAPRKSTPVTGLKACHTLGLIKRVQMLEGSGTKTFTEKEREDFFQGIRKLSTEYNRKHPTTPQFLSLGKTPSP